MSTLDKLVQRGIGTRVICQNCGGSGTDYDSIMGETESCYPCDGNGYLTELVWHPDPQVRLQRRDAFREVVAETSETPFAVAEDTLPF